MTVVLELREKLRNFYGKYEIYVTAGTKFVLSLVSFFLINSRMGYMEKLNNPAVVLILALVCTFLPVNAMVVIGCGLILAHLFALSMEVCAIALCLLLLLFFMYYKFAPDNGYSTMLTPVLCSFQIPQIMPVALGLLQNPSSYLSMACGAVIFYYVRGVQENIVNFTATDDTETLAKFTAAIRVLVGNKEMYLVIGTFLVTALLVYVIRRQCAAHIWKIALLVGNAVELAILLTGYIMLGMSEKLMWVVIGTVCSTVVSLILEFFFYNLDYSRIERVQFEDDEYYYYVKAVPKVFVSEKDKQVKQITPRKRTTINRRELAEELDIDQDLLD